MTINLAPADVRKEGSAFDLPLALGLVGCVGHFFGKPLDKCTFLASCRWTAAFVQSAVCCRRRWPLRSLKLLISVSRKSLRELVRKALL